jgi:hypothetical protein
MNFAMIFYLSISVFCFFVSSPMDEICWLAMNTSVSEGPDRREFPIRGANPGQPFARLKSVHLAGAETDRVNVHPA